MALSAEVLRVLSVRNDWMTQDEIRQQLNPQPKSLHLYLTLSMLVEHERIERRKEKGVTSYRLLQLGGSRAPKSKMFSAPKFAIPQPV